jgi:hypothetical protein
LEKFKTYSTSLLLRILVNFPICTYKALEVFFIG